MLLLARISHGIALTCSQGPAPPPEPHQTTDANERLRQQLGEERGKPLPSLLCRGDPRSSVLAGGSEGGKVMASPASSRLALDTSSSPSPSTRSLPPSPGGGGVAMPVNLTPAAYRGVHDVPELWARLDLLHDLHHAQALECKKLRFDLDVAQGHLTICKSENAQLKQESIRRQSQSEVSEELISNRLLRRISELKKEKTDLIQRVAQEVRACCVY